VTDDAVRSAILERFAAWSERPERPHERLQDLQDMAAEDPAAWAEAILSLVPDGPTDEYPGSLYWGLIGVLRAAPDRSKLEADLARRAHAHRTVASVVGGVLRFGSKGVGELHAIDVLGEDFVFDTWSRHNKSFSHADPRNQSPEHEVDKWAWELMEGIVMYDPDSAWTLFLRYLAHEDDQDCRVQAGIAWLESINFRYAEEFIERTELEARTNERLRATMRGMYPPGDPEVGRRFVEAMAEPDAPAS
jgi:hypothetical protein